MYTPAHFEEADEATLRRLMREHPLATLVTLASTGLNANHIPLHLATGDSPLGVLRGHVARANPVWKDLAPGVEALAIFQAADAYISPSWYPTKAATGKVVPTWNYAVAHAYGTLRVIEDPEWLRAHLRELTDKHEAAFPHPWGVDDAPADYIAKMMQGIVGIELVITRLQGKFKASQNQPAENREGAIRGLLATNDPHASAMADLMRKPPGACPHHPEPPAGAS